MKYLTYRDVQYFILILERFYYDHFVRRCYDFGARKPQGCALFSYTPSMYICPIDIHLRSLEEKLRWFGILSLSLDIYWTSKEQIYMEGHGKYLFGIWETPWIILDLRICWPMVKSFS